MKKIIVLIGVILLLGIVFVFSQAPSKITKDESKSESRFVSPLMSEKEKAEALFVLKKTITSPAMLDELKIELGLSDQVYEAIKEEIIASLTTSDYPLKEKIGNNLPSSQKELFDLWAMEALLIDKAVYGEISIPEKSLEATLLEAAEEVTLEPYVKSVLSEIEKNINLTKNQISEITQIIRTYKGETLILRLELFRIEDFPSSRKETQEKMIERRKLVRDRHITLKKNMLTQIKNVLQDKQRKSFKILEEKWEPNTKWNKDLENKRYRRLEP